MKKLIWILGVLSIVLVGTSIYFFFQNQSLNSQLLYKDKRISEQEKEINLCNKNKGKIINSFTENYRPSGFPLSSDLFKEKQIKVNEWAYNGGVIKEFIIELDDSVTVKLWDYFNEDHNRIEKRIFDDYGNSSPLETTVDQEYMKYKSAKGNVFIRRCGQLNASKTVTGIHSIYVQILGEQCIGFSLDEARKIILASTLASTKKLEEVADSLNF